MKTFWRTYIIITLLWVPVATILSLLVFHLPPLWLMWLQRILFALGIIAVSQGFAWGIFLHYFQKRSKA